MTTRKSHDRDPDPLITESTVEAFARARRESRAPARADAVSIGALNRLIAMLRGAHAVWQDAAAALGDETVLAHVTDEAAALERQIDAFERAVRALGGAPPDASEGDPTALPFARRELAYAGDDDAIQAGLAADRERMRQARNTAAAGAPLPEVRVLIESLRV